MIIRLKIINFFFFVRNDMFSLHQGEYDHTNHLIKSTTQISLIKSTTHIVP